MDTDDEVSENDENDLNLENELLGNKNLKITSHNSPENLKKAVNSSSICSSVSSSSYSSFENLSTGQLDPTNEQLITESNQMPQNYQQYQDFMGNNSQNYNAQPYQFQSNSNILSILNNGQNQEYMSLNNQSNIQMGILNDVQNPIDRLYSMQNMYFCSS